MTGLIIVLVLAGGAVFWYIATMNRFARLLVKIQEADSGIDVALTKRFDSLSKLLDVTKAYAKHEAETLANTIALRQGMSIAERSKANTQMNNVTDRINVLAEAYPELRSSDNFKELQLAVSEVEEHLQAARRIYNMNVSSFNQMLVSFPDSIVGKIRNHTAQEFFEAEEQKKQNIKMEF